MTQSHVSWLLFWKKSSNMTFFQKSHQTWLFFKKSSNIALAYNKLTKLNITNTRKSNITPYIGTILPGHSVLRESCWYCGWVEVGLIHMIPVDKFTFNLHGYGLYRGYEVPPHPPWFRGGATEEYFLTITLNNIGRKISPKPLVFCRTFRKNFCW